MKKIIFLLVVLAAAITANAQNKWYNNITGDIEASIGTRYKGLQQANLAVELGYLFCDRINPFFRSESSLMLYKHDGMKTYGNTYNIGGGVGVVLAREFDTNKKGETEETRYEVVASVTSSVGGRRDYRNNSYYAGFRLRLDGTFIGLGYRYMRSRECPIHDYSAFVFSIGF